MLFSTNLVAGSGDDFEELSVNVNVKGIGNAEIPALYLEEELYLSVTDVFNFLKIKNTYNENLDSISGFLIDENAGFLISKERNMIIYQNQKIELNKNDLIRYDGKLYLRRTYYGSVFGLQCNFNFRNLSVILDTDVDLPVIKEMRQELMRANLNKLKGDQIADTTIRRHFPIAHFGMADWLINNTHNLDGENDLRVNLALGAILFGGEASLSLNYFSNSDFLEKQQYYLWRHVNNDRKALRQVLLGKVQPQFTSSVYSPAVGAMITNTATTFNQSFGSYTISNTTNPGWVVELYVNNVLVNYVKADASGFYSFQVPLVYGSSVVKLRFYGPYGEERATEEYINIPFNFMPAGHFEYNVSGGFIEDGFHTYNITSNYGDSVVNTIVEGQKNSIFSKAKVNYGLNPYITVGGGVEYLSSVSSGSTMPFINTSIRLTPMLLLTADYTDKVVSRGVLTYSLPSNVQFELNYSKYDKNQKAIRLDYLEQLKALVSFPLRSKKFSAYSRISFNQVVLKSSDFITTEWLLSGSVKKVNYNLSSYALFLDEGKPYLYSNLSLGLHISRSVVVTPQMQYEYTQNKIVSYKCNIEKNIKGFGMINAYYEENIPGDIRFIGVGCRMDLDFAQVGLLAIGSSVSTSFNENANGSLIYDHNQKRVYANSRTSVGKGGITIAPFLDLNNNGLKDDAEPKANGIKLNINGGRIEYSESDTIIQIFDLEPYTSYYLKVQPGSFDNIAWSVKNKTIKVVVDPNNLKVVNIPVTVSSEISGSVYVYEGSAKRGLGKITIQIFDPNSKLVSKILSETDGYFSVMGLAPGIYRVQLDATQMKKLKLKAQPDFLNVELKTTTEGDVVDGLEFILQPE